MSKNNKHLFFVGGYAPKDKPSIHAFIFNSKTREITPQTAFTGIKNPSFLTTHPNGKWLYAVSEMEQDVDTVHGSVVSFSIENNPIHIQPINQQSTKGDAPCHLQIDRSGRWIIASNYGTGNAALFPILANGALGVAKAFIQHEGHGANKERQERAHVHSAIFTPDNRFLVVADLGIDQIVIYQFDAETGSLTRHASIQTRAGAGPRHFAFHPNKQHLLVANELDNTVTVYDYNAQNGTLYACQTISTLPPNAPESAVADIHFSPSGQHVYTSNRGHDSIALFTMTDDASLIYLDILPCGGKWPRNFTLTPDGQFILVANQHSNHISLLPIFADSPKFGSAVTNISVAQPTCVRFLL